MSNPVTITWRLRGFLGGSGTAMTPRDEAARQVVDGVLERDKLYCLLRDAANEIDRLNAKIASDAMALLPPASR